MMSHFDQVQTLLANLHGDFLVLRIARSGHEFPPAEHKLLTIQKRHLSVSRDVQGNALKLSFLDARRVELPAGFKAQLPAEEVPDAQPQITLPFVKALEPGFLPRQFRLLAAEGMRIFQLGEKLHGILHAIDTEIQMINLSEANPDFRLLGRRVGLARGNGIERFGGCRFLLGKSRARCSEQAHEEEQLRQGRTGSSAKAPRGRGPSRRAAVMCQGRVHQSVNAKSPGDRLPGNSDC